MDLLEEVKKKEIESKIKDCLFALSHGKRKCTMSYPNFRDIEVEIIGVSFVNVIWKPIHVKILEKGLEKEVQEWEDYPIMGSETMGGHVVTKKVPLREEWVQVEWLKDFKK